MSKISLSPDVAGTGIFTIASPGTSTNRTLTLPDDTGTIVTNSGNQAGSFTTLNTSGQVVFNDAGADVDFRVEGDTDANLLFVDASTDRVGIGTNTPSGLFDVANRGITKGSLPAGSVLQVVSTTKTDTFSESVASGALSGVVTGLTASITPSSASNKILVILSVTVNYEASYISLTENGSVIVQGDAAGNRQRVTGGTGLPFSEFYPMTTTVQFLHSPSSTSPLIYGCKLSSSSTATKTLYVNRGGTDTDVDEVMRGVSTITVMEIAA